MGRHKHKIAGFGVCGNGEAKRYLENTLKEFKRLCDETYIVCNRCSDDEINLVKKYGFNLLKDDREWGRAQWVIKEDAIKRIKADWFVVLDMDETFDKNFNREELEKLCDKGGTGYYFYVVNLIDDGYSKDWSFFNVRLFNGAYDRRFEQKALHCGLAPKIAYKWGNYAPFMLKHYGLKSEADRQNKVVRYEKYDPQARFQAKAYYDMLKTKVGVVDFDEDKVHDEVANEVKNYNFKIPQEGSIMKQRKFYLVENPGGKVVDIEEMYLAETLAREGFRLMQKEPIVQGGSEVETTRPANETPIENKEDEKKEEKQDETKEEESEKTKANDELTCSICGFVSKSKAGLTRHMKTHE